MLIRYLALLTIIGLTGCAGLRHGYTLDTYKKRMLATNTLEGQKRLQIEVEFDPSVYRYVQNFGNPNYLYVESGQKLYFIYLSPTKVVLFERSLISNISRVYVFDEIPNNLKSLIQEPTSAYHPKPLQREEHPWRSDGTGFAIDSHHVVTANHIVQGMKIIEVQFDSNDWLPAKITKASSLTDVAILSLETNLSKHLQLVEFPNTLQGDRVFTIGFPVVDLLGKESKYTEGVVSSLSGLNNDDCLLQVTVPVQPGNSGGPLIRRDGTVVGMITSSAAIKNFLAVTGTLPQNVNWAIKSEYIVAISGCKESPPVTKQERKLILENVHNSVCRIRAK